jgi:hypothetical protein
MPVQAISYAQKESIGEATHDPGPARVGPVLAADRWFDEDAGRKPLSLRMEFPLSAEEMVAALWARAELSAGDLDSDEAVWGYAALVLTNDGIKAIEQAADQILVREHRHVMSGEEAWWLAFLRRRVAEVTTCPHPDPS